MRARGFALALMAAAALLAGAGAVGAPPKVPRIGVITPAFDTHPGLIAFRERLRELGYVEGKTVVIEYRSARGDDARLPALAAELVNLPVNVILADFDESARQVQRLTKAIPIVVTTADPVASGLVDNAARPGGNSTGVGIVPPTLAKQFEFLKLALPHVARVGYLWHDCGAQCRATVAEARDVARTLKLEFVPVEVKPPYDFDDAFAAMRSANADAFIALPTYLFVSLVKPIVDAAGRARLPGMYLEAEFVNAGGLMAYGPNVPGVSRRAAEYVDKILRGAKPSDLPVDYPRDFYFVINYATARDLGLRIPASARQLTRNVE